MRSGDSSRSLHRCSRSTSSRTWRSWAGCSWCSPPDQGRGAWTGNEQGCGGRSERDAENSVHVAAGHHAGGEQLRRELVRRPALPVGCFEDCLQELLAALRRDIVDPPHDQLGLRGGELFFRKRTGDDGHVGCDRAFLFVLGARGSERDRPPCEQQHKRNRDAKPLYCDRQILLEIAQIVIHESSFQSSSIDYDEERSGGVRRGGNPLRRKRHNGGAPATARG